MRNLPLAGLAVLLLMQGGQADSPSPTLAELRKQAEAIKPTADECRWMQIPWARSAVEGQRLARAEKRPIMYWHVDDDPLGRC
jgi:hypothetical protein